MRLIEDSQEIGLAGYEFQGDTSSRMRGRFVDGHAPRPLLVLVTKGAIALHAGPDAPAGLVVRAGQAVVFDVGEWVDWSVGDAEVETVEYRPTA
jgi:hypothetical protein